MKANIAPSVRRALAFAFGLLLAAGVAVGCDSDEEQGTVQLSPNDVQLVQAAEPTAPAPVLQCKNSHVSSVWTKSPSSGLPAAAPLSTLAQCPDASAD
jgi:hypothetical protein